MRQIATFFLLLALAARVCGGYTVIAAPTITGVKPLCGPSGGTFTITGTNFYSDTKVSFVPDANCSGCTTGTTLLTCTVVSSTSVTCTTPAVNGGNYDEVLTNSGGTVTHLEPTVASPPC